jgi:hypothetical protein
VPRNESNRFKNTLTLRLNKTAEFTPSMKEAAANVLNATLGRNGPADNVFLRQPPCTWDFLSKKLGHALNSKGLLVILSHFQAAANAPPGDSTPFPVRIGVIPQSTVHNVADGISRTFHTLYEKVRTGAEGFDDFQGIDFYSAARNLLCTMRDSVHGIMSSYPVMIASYADTSTLEAKHKPLIDRNERTGVAPFHSLSEDQLQEQRDDYYHTLQNNRSPQEETALQQEMKQRFDDAINILDQKKHLFVRSDRDVMENSDDTPMPYTHSLTPQLPQRKKRKVATPPTPATPAPAASPARVTRSSAKKGKTG